MFEDKIFEDIIKTWQQDQEHPYRDRRVKPIPVFNDVKVVVELAFSASLKNEEGKPITFSLVFLPKNRFETEQKLSGRKQMITCFDKALLFTIESIKKIALAFDPKTTAMIVGRKDNNSIEYEIWGTMVFKKSYSRFEEIPAAYHDFNFFRPDAMMVTAISGGSLIISRGDSVLGHFINGEFLRATPSCFTSTAMGSYIINCISKNHGYIKHENLYWNIYRDSLDYLISEISVRGHGGTLIILPDDLKMKYDDKINKKYLAKQDFQIEKLILKVLNLEERREKQDLLLNVLLKRLIAERLDVVAQLACVDGALILSSCFDLISFGATLHAKKWDGKVLIGPDGFKGIGGNFNHSILGTRHNSAIDFIGDCPKAIGFVISQDGLIRGFVKGNGNTILCWPNCRVSMFV